MMTNNRSNSMPSFHHDGREFHRSCTSSVAVLHDAANRISTNHNGDGQDKHEAKDDRNHKRYKENNLDPPGITMAASTSSLSSDSSTSATFAVAPTSSSVPYRAHHNDHPYSRHPRAPCNVFSSSKPMTVGPPPPPCYPVGNHNNVRRGMVLAMSPPQPQPQPRTPPPTQTAARRSPEIASPPNPYRVTSHPCVGQRIPFVVPIDTNRRNAGRQQKQQNKGRSRHQQSVNSSRERGGGGGGVNPYAGGHFCCYPFNPYARIPLQPYNLFPSYGYAPEVIGHPSLRVYKLRLPAEYMHLLDEIVKGCEAFARGRKTGWRTDLYSLTKQDVALVDVPGMLDLAKPISQYMTRSICELYHADSVRVDRNQPHVLKYSADHTGVELHHDRCDVTANLMMSRSHTYVGGGTYIPDANKVVRLKYGEFLLHPGQLVHGGMDITNGTRYLMVLFAHLK